MPLGSDNKGFGLYRFEATNHPEILYTIKKILKQELKQEDMDLSVLSKYINEKDSMIDYHETNLGIEDGCRAYELAGKYPRIGLDVALKINKKLKEGYKIDKANISQKRLIQGESLKDFFEILDLKTMKREKLDNCDNISLNSIDEEIKNVKQVLNKNFTFNDQKRLNYLKKVRLALSNSTILEPSKQKILM